ncbi:MAG: EF-Tu/IF-2/RF-3 family GTPase, partial [Thermoanaerobaculia bacterium]
RPTRDLLGLMDELESVLGIHAFAMNWPLGTGPDFAGVYDRLNEQVHFFQRTVGGAYRAPVKIMDLSAPAVRESVSEAVYETIVDELEMLKAAGSVFDAKAVLEGKLTPVLFGSAINNFGVQLLLDSFLERSRPPQGRVVNGTLLPPDHKPFSGFVFKIQANMDPKHRDRIAFVRLCSGRFERGMKLLHVRSGKTMSIHNPVLFLARERELAEEAWAGDILGIPNHGNLRIGDALTEGEELRFTGIPSFAPELLKKVRAEDPMRSKHLGRALLQLAEEGAAQVFRPTFGNEWIVGVAGALQFDVLADRIRTEYNIPVHFEGTTLFTARWVDTEDHQLLKKFTNANHAAMAEDHNGSPVFLARNAWHLKTTGEEWPNLKLLKTKEQVQ